MATHKGNIYLRITIQLLRKGLNLLGISVEEVEDLTQLWEILSDMN